MKGFRLGFWVALATLFFIRVAVGAAEYSGLWVGTATIKAVTEVNQREPDLSFDLGLEGVKVEDKLISPGDTWKYNDTGTDPGTGWEASGYDDSAWSAGQAALGYGAQEATTVSYGPDPDEKHRTTYFRKRFHVEDPSLYSGLRMQVWRDDGIIIYMNGEEILRNNLSTSYVGFDSTALSEIKEKNYLEITLPATLLESGENWLAAEVHLVSKDDTDLLFNVALAALLKEPVFAEIIPLESDGWRFHDSQWGPGASSETDLIDTDWHATGYDDSGWPAGKAQFGYGEGDEETVFGYSSSRKPPTTYFRKIFSAPGADYTHLRIMLLQDDGAAVYVNGTEVMRANMPPGPIGHTTAPVKALGSADENRYIVKEIDLSEIEGLSLQQNSNMLAVEVHQHPSELGNTAAAEAALTRTPATLDLRFLLHMDSGGTVRLLKEVIQMYDAKNEKLVLLTDHTLIPNFTGVGIQDGELVGRRLSAVGFDFDTSYIECTGAVSLSGTVTCSFTLTSDHPTNPFLHRFHPDHDNLDARYEYAKEEAYPINREIKIEFNDRYPPDEDKPEWPRPPFGWGESLLGGTYTETLKGLHKDDIKVSGPFILRRVTDIASLNE